MATYTAATVKHQTLAANVVDTVTLTFAGTAANLYPDQVEVFVRGTTDPIYWTADGSTPTVEGDNCYVSMPGNGLTVPCATAPVTVKLKSAGAMAYSVTAS
jgi:hypothetical protein